MNPVLLLDTHVWLWYAVGDCRSLSERGAAELAALDGEGRLRVSIMSVWELGLLQQRGRIRLGCSTAVWVERFLERSRFQVAGLSLDIVTQVHELPGDLHRDPVDRLLIATARHHNWTLVTADQQILDYARQGHVAARTL